MIGTGIVAVAILAGYVWWMMTIGQDEWPGLVGTGLFQSAAAMFAMVCCLRNSRFFAGGSAPNAWTFYAIGTFLVLSAHFYGTLALIFYGEFPRMLWFPRLMESVQYLLYLAALRYHFADRDKRIPLIRYYLDTWIFSIGIASLYWHHLLEPVMDKPLYQDSGLPAFLISTFVLAMWIGLSYLCVSGRSTETRPVILLLIGAFLLKAVSCFWNLHQIFGNGGGLPPVLANMGSILGFILLGIAAVVQSRNTSARLMDNLHPIVPQKPVKAYRIVPTVAMLSVLLAFTSDIRQPDAYFIGIVLITYLLLVRLWVNKYAFRMAEQALSEAEEKYRNLVENSQVGVFSAQYGELTYVNRYFAETFGYEPDEMVGTSFMHYFSEEDREKLAVEISRLAMNRGFTPHIGVRGIKRDGGSVHLEVQVTRTVHHGDVIITGTLLDITERKLAEEMVIRSEKLSVVGQLAAGVAHEIRNPLTSLRGFTQLLKSRDGDGQNNEFYDIMLNELDRINYIVGEFMLLSRPQQMQKLEHHDLRELISGMLPIIETQAIIHNVTINMDWKTPIKPVLCDQNQIKQVFMNVLKNAIEAMTGGGTIRIRFYTSGNEYTGVQIVDEGPGMPADVLARLGEPFFTTKKTGTGLGLMVCYRIIEAHNGKMIIKSEKGKGTTVEIQFRSSHDGWNVAMNI